MTLALSIERFVAASIDAPDTASLIFDFEEMMEAFGFESISYHVIQRSFRTLSAEEGQRMLISFLKMSELFEKDQAIGFDPLIAAAIAKLEPFRWFEMAGRPELTAQQQRIFRRLSEDNYLDGIAVPVITRPGDLALFGLSTAGRRFQFKKPDLRLLQFACLAMHTRYNELETNEKPISLSNREREVMELVAGGKSKTEIAERLEVSPHTVDTLIRRSFSKLGVKNRVEASIKLAYGGFLAKAG